MTVEEAVRTLGKCIQADPRYQQYQQAKQNNDADTALQEQIGAFNMKRMSYQRKMDEDRGRKCRSLAGSGKRTGCPLYGDSEKSEYGCISGSQG